MYSSLINPRAFCASGLAFLASECMCSRGGDGSTGNKRPRGLLVGTGI